MIAEILLTIIVIELFILLFKERDIKTIQAIKKLLPTEKAQFLEPMSFEEKFENAKNVEDLI